MRRRCIGVETEFGVYLVGNKHAPSRDISEILIKELIEPGQLVPTEMINNGGRLYVDVEHIEYASPEATDYMTAAKYDAAGSTLMANMVLWAHPLLKERLGGGEVRIYKNNTDTKGNSYGCHENYQVFVKDFNQIADILEPYLCTRHIWAGAGDLVMSRPRFEISQRARSTMNYIEFLVQREMKPFIKLQRDDDYCEGARRIQVVGGDSNVSHAVIALKLGITSLMFEMAESGYLTEPVVKLHDPIVQLALTSEKPFRLVRTDEYEEIRAHEIQRCYLHSAAEYFAGDHEAERLIEELTVILDHCDTLNPRALIGKTEWATKLHLLKSFSRPEGAPFEECENLSQLKALDLACHDVSGGWFERFHDEGVFERLWSPRQLARAAVYPPRSRALTRRRIMEMCRDSEVRISVNGIDWDKAKLFRPDGSIYELDLGEPEQVMSKEQLRKLIHKNRALKRPRRTGTPGHWVYPYGTQRPKTP